MINIKEEQLREMIRDAVSGFPEECCGFFFGKEKGDNRLVTSVLPVINRRQGDRRRKFEIAPPDYLKAERLADEAGLLLIGVYHSHPNHPALPSEHDRLAAQPFFSYIILSVYEQEFRDIRSWRLTDENRFEEETIHIHHSIKQP